MTEAFPDEELFTFSLGGMRTFGELVSEMLGMAAPMLRGIITGKWIAYSDRDVSSKAEILRLWDEATKELNDLWPRIPTERFQETITSFGQFEGKVYWQVLYLIDNEIHHRGQGYVYLRALDVEPPAFYDRS